MHLDQEMLVRDAVREGIGSSVRLLRMAVRGIFDEDERTDARDGIETFEALLEFARENADRLESVKP